MKCANPYMYKHTIPFGCGQCMACRKNKLRLWQHRLMLEGMCHTKSVFVTCTYKPEKLPENGSLDYRDHTLFMKRLREEIYPTKIRFYGVGEYGEDNGRPHFHYAIFGIGKDSHDAIARAWGNGFVHTGYDGEEAQINEATAAYICGYITKKMTSWSDKKVKELLLSQGKRPERAWFSNRPGIGALAVDKIVESLSGMSGLAYIDRVGDVPMVIKHRGRQWPLGRYLRKKIREGLGFQNPGGQEGWYEKAKARFEEEMLELCVSQGVVGLLKEEEQTEELRVFKKMTPWGWKKELLRRRNIELNKQLELKENLAKKVGRRL